MYKALTSFTTNTYDIKQGQILQDDFTTPNEIQEYLEIGYIENYVPTGAVENEYSESTTDGYSCDYINTQIGAVETILDTITTGAGVGEEV